MLSFSRERGDRRHHANVGRELRILGWSMVATEEVSA